MTATTTQPTNTTSQAPARDVNGPRNQLGERATRTPKETVARLKEKVSKNQGGANRERIQAQISKEVAPQP